jgi:hypothetical protein
MQKKYIVRLTDEERVELQGVIKKLKGSSQKVRRAQVCRPQPGSEPLSQPELSHRGCCRMNRVCR